MSSIHALHACAQQAQAPRLSLADTSTAVVLCDEHGAVYASFPVSPTRTREQATADASLVMGLRLNAVALTRSLLRDLHASRRSGDVQ